MVSSNVSFTFLFLFYWQITKASSFLVVGNTRNPALSFSTTNLFLPNNQRYRNPTLGTRLYLESPSNHTGSRLSLVTSHSRQQQSTTTELSASFSDVAVIGFRQIYCDLDGVLADFEKGIINLLGKTPSELVKGTMWKHVARADAFYENLDFTYDGKDLWDAIRHLQPDILTGVPYPKSSRIEKYNWCKEKLGTDTRKFHHVDMASGYRDHAPVNGKVPEEGVTNIITCWSNNKAMECSYGS
jgi:hypothetical protein